MVGHVFSILENFGRITARSKLHHGHSPGLKNSSVQQVSVVWQGA